MRTAIILVALVTVSVSAFGSFTTGGSDLFGISGYNKIRYTMWGQEGHDPGSGFDFYNRTAWSPRVSDILAAKLSFDTRYGFTSWDSLTGTYVSDDFTLKLVEAYGTLEFSSAVSLRGGRFKLPFGFEYYRPGYSIPYYDRAAVAGTPCFLKYGGLDVGIMLTTDFGPVLLDLAYTNGTDSRADTTMNKQFTARLWASPFEQLSLGASVAIVGQPELEATDEWSTTGLDFFAHGRYSLNSDLSLDYEGEYLVLPWPGPVMDNMVNEDGGAFNFSLAGNHEVEMGILTAIQPAVRYEMISPPEQIASGADVPESDISILDFCLNLHTGKMNTVQIGGRSWAFENGDDGYTDVYVNWRMLF